MAFTNLPGSLKSAVYDQDSLTGSLRGQGSRLNSLSSAYNQRGSYLADTAINNLLKYGEVSENDLVGNAVTDNTLAYGKAYDAAVRDMTRMGINPNSGRFAGMSQNFALNRAAAEAGARNQARLQARNENYQRANSLAGLGYNYNSLGLNAANAAINALNTAAANQDRYAQSVAGLYKLDTQAGFDNDLANLGASRISYRTGTDPAEINRAAAYAAGLGGFRNLSNYRF